MTLRCYFCGTPISDPMVLDVCHGQRMVKRLQADGRGTAAPVVSTGECGRYTPPPFVLAGMATPEQWARHMELLRADEALAMRTFDQMGPWMSDAAGYGNGF